MKNHDKMFLHAGSTPRPLKRAGLFALFISMLLAAALPAKAELISYWNFNDGTSAQDQSGENDAIAFKNYEGAATHSADTPPGGGEFSLDLTHGQDYVLLPSVTFEITNEFTISLWIKYSSPGRSVFSIKRDLTGGGGDRSGIGLGVQNGVAYLGLISSAGDDSANSGGTYHDIRTSTPVPSNQWVHLAATVQNDRATIYINGTAETQYSGAGSSDGTLKVLGQTIDLVDANSSFTGFGADGSAPTPASDTGGDLTTSFFDGLLDEAAVWNVALSPVDIEFLAEGGSVPDALTLTVTEVEPANNAMFLPAETVIRFTAESTSGIDDEGIQLIVNGEDKSGELSISGGPMEPRTAIFDQLSANQEYVAEIIVTDRDGKERRQTITFDTLSEGTIFVEAEDYDFEGGQYINDPGLASFPAADNYLDRMGVPGVDHHVLAENDNPYRIGDPVGTDFADDFPLREKFVEAQLIDPGVEDYALDELQNGEWLNYTRDFPADQYRIFARVGASSGFNLELGAVTGSGASQEVVTLGSFDGSGTGGTRSYSLVPLDDADGNPLIIPLSGEQTLRLTVDAGGGSTFLNYLFFVPASGGAPAALTVIEPSPGTIGVATNAPIRAVIVNQATAVQPESLRLVVNGEDVTAAAETTITPQGLSLNYPSPGWPEGSVQDVVLTFEDDAMPANLSSNAWSFTVRRSPKGETPEIFADAVLRVTFEENSPVDRSSGAVSEPIVAENISYTTDVPPMANRTGNAAVFDGTSSWISYGLGAENELNIRSNLTYHARVRFDPASFAAGRPEQWIFGRFRSTDQGSATRVSILSTSGIDPSSETAQVFGGVSATGTGWAEGLPGQDGLEPGIFYDVFLRFEPGVAVSFDVFNAETGARIGDPQRLATTVTVLKEANSPLDVGNRTTPSNTPLAGDIEQINVWARTLSDAEIYAISHGPSVGGGTVTITELRVSGGQLELDFTHTGEDGEFSLEAAESLTNPEWMPVNEATFAPGSGGGMTAQFPAPAAANQFYRVVMN